MNFDKIFVCLSLYSLLMIQPLIIMMILMGGRSRNDPSALFSLFVDRLSTIVVAWHYEKIERPGA